jgi:hypothetical protein
MKRINYIYAGIAILAIVTYLAPARMQRVSQIPNGSKYNCTNCHISPYGGGNLTPFGGDVQNNLSGGVVQWGATLANLDSDNDGFTNGQELLDPSGTWVKGQPNPGNSANAGNPGDSKSTPVLSDIKEIVASLLSISPNPANSKAVLSFHNAIEMNYEINLVDINGRIVSNLYNNIASAGQLNLDFQLTDISGNKLSAGEYLITIRTESNLVSTKLIIE